jgi:hypothetical protein
MFTHTHTPSSPLAQSQEESIAQSTGQLLPESQVDTLMSQVADEHGLAFESDLDAAGVGKQKREVEAVAEPEADDLMARLKKLQNN